MQLFLSPDFNIRSLRRKPKSAAQKIKELKENLQSHNLTNIDRELESFSPASLFDQHRLKTSRRRIYSKDYAFYLQQLKISAEQSGVAIHAFVLMINNLHLLGVQGVLTPRILANAPDRQP